MLEYDYDYSDLAVETCLTLIAVFHLRLRTLEGFVNFLLTMMDTSLQSPVIAVYANANAAKHLMCAI
ncbi:transposase [Pseudoalteromonas aurantia]|uniref:Transposase DDE domain-containing protein n=1 Tax=Pseudoalteromonas aurantia TaxID=43654 RepID=A0A5S3V765_9GAMM|nr:hypothetical protein CWC18_10450 [Pseudoalteromonas aurantia]TMO67575.1 hypothetical protein CWC19_13620 [Pseudoalteromonas aurantia]TMO73348.1 hypothetical protein CWC20_13615 [Pseudoalteromonas aurantia]